MKWVVGLILFFTVIPLFATTYSLPSGNNDLIGRMQYTSSRSGDSLLTIGSRFEVGLNQIGEANLGFNPMAPLPSNVNVRIPSEFILPPLPHQGIVVNLPEMRLYYYPGDGSVMTYPVGIGRVGKTIPIKRTIIVRKVTNPTWIPPEDIRAFNEETKGITLPYAMGPGPDNPLGPYAIYLGIPTYLIHSTIFPESIGTRASFGCIRMHEDDIKEFFPLVQRGVPVVIIDMPFKIGWHDNLLYLESHPPLEERDTMPTANMPWLVQSIENAMSPNQVVIIDWQTVSYLAKNPDGIPHDIGFIAS